MPTQSDEAAKIYHAIFNKEIPAVTREHFKAISKIIEHRFPDEEIKKSTECIANIHDLEALELAARHLGKLPVFTLKFKIMFYWAETVPENYSEFINEKDDLMLGSLLLLASVFRSFYKLVKGIFIMIICRI